MLLFYFMCLSYNAIGGETVSFFMEFRIHIVDGKAVAPLVKLQRASSKGRDTESTDCRKFNKVSFIRILTDIYPEPAGYSNTSIHRLEINTRIQVYSRTYFACSLLYSLTPSHQDFFHATPHFI
jgi:hypothetical protein